MVNDGQLPWNNAPPSAKGSIEPGMRRGGQCTIGLSNSMKPTTMSGSAKRHNGRMRKSVGASFHGELQYIVAANLPPRAMRDRAMSRRKRVGTSISEVVGYYHNREIIQALDAFANLGRLLSKRRAEPKCYKCRDVQQAAEVVFGLGAVCARPTACASAADEARGTEYY